MKSLAFALSLFVLASAAETAQAQSLWDRRDPQFANLFMDTRARYPGDLLTIVINESTEFEGTEKKELDTQTNTNAALAAKGNYSVGKLTARDFAAAFDGSAASGRKFDGKANNSIDRRLLDRMTVTVVGVLPNGNLVVEGRRARVITNETRILVVSGVVRPLDIGPYNTIQSQFIADFRVVYEGKGPESRFTNQGWLGKVMNYVWPF
ncbi:MAG TPA: flagellar basal body L-ring protein FlgH [Gemmataceae bacterium]|nr:flagellar basal body L-ring protein FlgH [Gemmataceae bacterium]